jgi:recombination protein RecA
VGARTKIKVVKNKVAAPFKVTEFDIIYNEGISKEGEMIALGEKYGVIQKVGQMYNYGEVKLGRGYDATRTFLRENKKLSDKILSEIRAKMKEAPVPQEKPDDGEEPEE